MRRTFAVAAIAFMAFGVGRPAAAQKCGQPIMIAPNMPSDTIARMVVDQMFGKIVLTKTQHAKAVVIVGQANTDVMKLDRKAPDFAKKFEAVKSKRNDDLMKLLAKKDDKAKLAACFKQMESPPRAGG